MAENRPANTGISGSEFSSIGVQFALVILVFTGAGIWLDRRLGTSPWLLLVCVFVGAGGGFFSIYRKAMDAQRRDERQRAARKAEREAARPAADESSRNPSRGNGGE